MENKIKEGIAELKVGQFKNDLKCFEKAKKCFQEVLNSKPQDELILTKAKLGLESAEFEIKKIMEAL